jgi:hypothetical protein
MSEKKRRVAKPAGQPEEAMRSSSRIVDAWTQFQFSFRAPMRGRGIMIDFAWYQQRRL